MFRYCKLFAMERAKEESEYYARWARHYSETVKFNMCPYFEWFTFIKLPEETKKLCETLPGTSVITNKIESLVNICDYC